MNQHDDKKSTTGLASALISARHLHYSIDGVNLLNDINIHINKGELVGLIGPNGAGKSTLLRLLTCMEEPNRGEVFYQQKLICSVPAARRAKEICYLAQGAKAQWPVSVEKIVELGRLPHQKWWQRSSSKDFEKVEEALRLTETIAYRNRVITTLSGGEQTLVMLARIFATEPAIIIADEPVAALDPYHQLHVMELLRDHVGHQNNAGVVVLHDLSLAARFCDRLYLLNHGKIHCSGRPTEVLNNKNIAEVYGVKSIMQCNNDSVSVTPIERLKQQHP